MPRADPSRKRCAIYSRKSSEEGLEQEFNSLQAQSEACEAYIRSQPHEGWVLARTRYDDGGFSGGNIERPALQRLLADIQGGVQAKAWGSSRWRFDFPRGGLQQCPSEKSSQGEPGRGQHVPFSGLVQSHTPAQSRVFAAVGMEGTGETDWPAEERRFEPSVPLATVSLD